MYFVKVYSMDGNTYTHAFNDENEAMDFRLMAEEDGTYLAMWSNVAIKNVPFLYKINDVTQEE